MLGISAWNAVIRLLCLGCDYVALDLLMWTSSVIDVHVVMTYDGCAEELLVSVIWKQTLSMTFVACDHGLSPLFDVTYIRPPQYYNRVAASYAGSVWNAWVYVCRSPPHYPRIPHLLPVCCVRGLLLCACPNPLYNHLSLCPFPAFFLGLYLRRYEWIASSS